MPNYKENDPETHYPSYFGTLSEEEEEEAEAQFDPLIRDAIPPRIYNLDIDESQDWGWKTKSVYGVDVPYLYYCKHVWVRVQGTIFDISGVSNVAVEVKGGDSYYEEFPDESTTVNFDTGKESLDILSSVNYLTYTLGSYSILISASDGAGNSAVLEKEMKSVVASLVDTFINLLGESWNAAVEAAKALGSMIWDWIVEQVMKIWNSMIEPLIEVVKGYLKGITDSMLRFFAEINDFDWEGSSTIPTGFVVEDEKNDVIEAGLAFLLSFLGLQDYAETVMDGLQEIMKFIEPFTNLINPTKIITIVLGKVPFVENLFNFMQEGKSYAIEAGLEILFSSENGFFTNVLRFVGINTGASFDSEDTVTHSSLVNIMRFAFGISEDNFLLLILNYFSKEYGDSSQETKADDEVSCAQTNIMMGVIDIIISYIFMTKLRQWASESYAITAQKGKDLGLGYFDRNHHNVYGMKRKDLEQGSASEKMGMIIDAISLVVSISGLVLLSQDIDEEITPYIGLLLGLVGFIQCLKGIEVALITTVDLDLERTKYMNQIALFALASAFLSLIQFGSSLAPLS